MQQALLGRSWGWALQTNVGAHQTNIDAGDGTTPYPATRRQPVCLLAVHVCCCETWLGGCCLDVH
jgi:hypothetical protein